MRSARMGGKLPFSTTEAWTKLSKPRSLGSSRTTTQIATAMANVTAALATMEDRQPNARIASESGTPASTPPKLPRSRATPVTVAKRLAGNQCPASFMQVTNATPTEAPISRRPA